MELNIDPDISWDVPEGNHTGTLIEARHDTKITKEGSKPFIRLIFQIDGLSTTTTSTQAGKNFPATLRKGGTLREALEGWLGEEFIEKHRTGAKFEVDTAVGQKADLLIRHIHNEEYSQPFVSIQGIGPPGSLTSTSQDCG